MKSEVRLAPNEKWRIEIDFNYLEQLRLAMGYKIVDLQKAGVISTPAYNYLRLRGRATMGTVEKLATYFQIQPGELLVWFPVPKDFPDHPRLGKGRTMSQRKRPGAPKRAFRWWRPEDDELLLNMRAVGFTWRDIGVRLGRTKGAVKDRWYTVTFAERMAEHGTVEIPPNAGTRSQVDDRGQQPAT